MNLALVEIKDNMEENELKWEKPIYMTDEEWMLENRIEVEDAEYNEKRIIRHLRDFDVPVKYKNSTFDTFIGNDKVKQTCKKYADEDCDILLSGPTGCGKTHLAVSIMRDIIAKGILKHPMKRAQLGHEKPPYTGKIIMEPGALGDGRGLFITVPKLLMELRSVFSGDKKYQADIWSDSRKMTEEDVINEYTALELLVLDDLGAEKTTDYSLTSLYMIIDERINNFKRTIITTNLSLQELEEKMDARVASRLSGMKIIKINMPDYRKKR